MEVSVADVMTKDVFSVSPSMLLSDLEWELSKRRIGGAPVVEDGKLVGMISRADIVRRIGFSHAMSEMAMDYYRQLESSLASGQPQDHERLADQTLGSQLRTLHVRDAMTTRPTTIAPDSTARQAAQLMLQKRVHRLVVVQDSRPVGLVSTLDLMRVLATSDTA